LATKSTPIDLTQPQYFLDPFLGFGHLLS